MTDRHDAVGYAATATMRCAQPRQEGDVYGSLDEQVARFGPDDVERLLADAGIVRNRAKLLAAVANARAVLEMRDRVDGGLDALIWSFAPDPAGRPAPRTLGDVPATTAESAALSKALKKRGFVFVGPTTAYASMQACGLVDDHLVGCHARGAGGSA